MPSFRMHRGFTLVEILIVVVILGILAAIVIPQFTAAADEARRTSFTSTLDLFTRDMTRYLALEGLPPDTSSGQLNDDLLATYINKPKFEAGTPLGGVWDIESDDLGVQVAIGVHFNDGTDLGDAYMSEVDRIVDDGDLEAGSFRKLADDRFYSVLR